ncbi:mucin-2-like [Planococcus citri]|uniref:mucin-2-like n=1 Tax=Planococcus citri TaxID=170843 RepID=UPI0031F7667E
MLTSNKIQLVIIPIFSFISHLNSQIRAENDLEYPLEIPSLLTTSEIAEEIMNQNLNSNCTNLRAFFNSESFQEVEKILNMTVDSTEVNENREEYHSRMKRCTEMEKQNRILKEFQRRSRQKESSDNQKSGRSHFRQKNLKNTNILQTTHKDSILQHNLDQDVNSDDVLRSDLAHAMTDAMNMETYSRTYRTLPSNPKQFTVPLPNTSTEKNEYSSDLVEYKSKMLKGEQRSVGDFLQSSTFPKDSKHTTKSSESARNTKKGPLKSLLQQIKYTMQGGVLKNSQDNNNFDSKEKSSSSDVTSEEDIEYEPVKSHTFFNNFDHVTTPNQRSKNEKDVVTQASAANSEIIRRMHEETRKQLQAKIDDLTQIRKKLLVIVMMANSAKNQTRVSTPTIKNIKKTKGTTEKEILAGKNSKNNLHFKTTNQNKKTDARSEVNSGSKYGVNLFPKNVTSPTPKLLNKIKHPKTASKESQKRRHEKNTTMSSKTRPPSNQIETLGHHTTQSSSSESPVSKHQFPDPNQHSKIHLLDTDSSQNQDHEDSSFSTRSQSIKIRDKNGRDSLNSENEQQRVQDVTEKTASISSTELKHDFPKTTTSAQPSTNSKRNTHTKPTSNKKKSPATKDSTKLLTPDDKAAEISSSTMKNLEYVQTFGEPAYSEKRTTLGVKSQTTKNTEILPKESEGIDVTENENQSTKDNTTVTNSMAKHQKITAPHSTTLVLPLKKSEHLPDITSKMRESSQISSSQLVHQHDVSNGPTSSQILLSKENEPKMLPQTSTVDLNKVTTPLYNEFLKETPLIKHLSASTRLQISDNAMDRSEMFDSASESSYLKEVTKSLHFHQHELHSDTSINPQSFQPSTEILTKSTSTLEPSYSKTTPTTSHQHETLLKTTSHSSDTSTGQSIIRSQEDVISSEDSYFDEITPSHPPPNKEHAPEWPNLKKIPVLQHKKSSEKNIVHLNNNFSKITTDQPTPFEHEIDYKDSIPTESHQLNRNSMSQSSDEDEVPSQLVGKSQQSISTENHQVKHPATIPKPLISPLLEKFKHQLHDKLEEIRRNITLQKQTLGKMSTLQPLHLRDSISSKPVSSHESQSDGNIPSSYHHHSYNPSHSSQTSTLPVQTFHHLDESTMKSTSHKLNAESTLTSHLGHQHLLPHYLDKTSTIQPFHSIEKSLSGVIIPSEPHTKNHIPVLPHPELPHKEKFSTLEPFHSNEKLMNGITSSSKLHKESHIVSNGVHNHIDSLHMDKLSTFPPSHSIEKLMSEDFLPSTTFTENHSISYSVHPHKESVHQDKPSTLQPLHSTEKSTNGVKNYKVPQAGHYHQESVHNDKLPIAKPSHQTGKPINGVTLPTKPYTENHMIQHVVHPDIEPLHQDKHPALQPSHSTERSMSRANSPAKHHSENHIVPHTVHSQIESLHKDKLPTLQPAHSIEKSTNGIENHMIPQPGHHLHQEPLHNGRLHAAQPSHPTNKVHPHIESLHQDKLSSLQPPHSIEKSMNENHMIPPKHHLHPESLHADGLHAAHPSHPTEKVPLHIKSSYQDKFSTHQPPHSIEKSADGVALSPEPHIKNHVIPHPDHRHIESQHQDELSTIQSNPQLKRKSSEAPYQISTQQSSHHHHHPELTDFEKNAAHQPSHAHETFPKEITSSQTFHDENIPNSYLVHSHSSHTKHSNEISTPQPSHPHEEILKGHTLPMETHTDSHSIFSPLPHHHNHHPDTPHFGSSHTLQPSHPTEMPLNKITLPEKSQNQIHSISEQFRHPEKNSAQSHLTPPPFHLLIDQAKTLHQNNTWTVLKEMQRLEKMKIEEIKHLREKYYNAVHELQKNNLFPSSGSDSDLLHKQQNTKTHITDGTSTHSHHSHNQDVPGRSASQQDIEAHNSLHNLHTTKPYSTSSNTYTTLKNYDENMTLQDDKEIVEKIPFPLPPVNPNENWKYVKKLEKFYEKQNKITTPKPPAIIRPPSINPTSQPRITPHRLVIPSPTTAPTTVPPRMRPMQPSRNATVPKRQRTSTAAPPTQKPPSPVNYNINSTINRNYNITINLVTPDSASRENDEDGDEPENNEPSTIDEFNPFTNLARPTDPIKTENKKEPTGDFDSSPHPSLPRQLLPQSYNSSNLPPANETPSFSSSTISDQRNQPTPFLRTEIDLNEEPSVFENKDAILQTPIPTAPKLPDTSSPSASTTVYQEIVNNLNNITKRVQSQSHFDPTTQPSTTFTSDNKTDNTLSHSPCSNVNCTLQGCNNIIIIPNKTEEIMEILRLLNVVNPNDQAQSTNQPPTFFSPKSVPDAPDSLLNLFSDIKSLQELIQKSKLTPLEKTELRKSVADLLTALKQRRSNEYTRLYLSKVNPMVGDSRDSVQAITQINEYIELLELMLVYLARDPDRLLDESKDARFDNFESPYPKDDPQRRLIEDQFHYVHPKILNEFIDVYKKYSKDETYYGKPIWQFSQENDPPRRPTRHRSLGSSLSNLLHLKDLIPALTYDRSPMYRPGIQYADYQN